MRRRDCSLQRRFSIRRYFPFDDILFRSEIFAIKLWSCPKCVPYSDDLGSVTFCQMGPNFLIQFFKFASSSNACQNFVSGDDRVSNFGDQSRMKNPLYPRPGEGGGGSRISGASCYVWKYFFLVFFNVFKIFVKIFVQNVTYLFNIWISHSSMLYLHVYVCIVHTVYENALLFSLEY